MKAMFQVPLSIVSAAALFACTAVAAEKDAGETMCVKQKDGTYKCLASGKVEKESCCQTPKNDPTPSPSPKNK